MSKTCLILGLPFRPPAGALISALHTGAELLLEHEPDNPYDENAIKVVLATAAIKPEAYVALAYHAERYGYDLESILAETEWHLGYVPPDMNTVLGIRAAKTGSFLMSSDGKPAIHIDCE